MMFPWPHSSRTPIGVDLGGCCIRAAQLRGAPGRWRLESYARIPRKDPGSPPGPEEALRLRDILRRQGFRGQDVVVAVPPEKLLAELVEAPPNRPSEEAAVTVGAELAKTRGCQPGALEVAVWPLPPSPCARARHEVLATACRHEDADALLDVLEGVGLNVLALDAYPAAMQRACRPVLRTAAGIVGVLDVGWTLSQLAVFYKDSAVYFRAVSETGIATLCKTLGDRLAIPLQDVHALLAGEGAGRTDQTLAEVVSAAKLESVARLHFAQAVEEVRPPFQYVMQQYPEVAVERLLLAGDGVGAAGLAQVLENSLGVKTRAITSEDLGIGSPAAPEECPAAVLALAVGLAEYYW